MKTSIEFEINNPRLETRHRNVELDVPAGDINFFVEHGYLCVPSMFSPGQLKEMGDALLKIADSERTYRDPNNPDTSMSAMYLRWLIDKDAAFEHLFNCKMARSIARAVLGPQVHFENVDGRICPPGVAGQVVPWHIHLRSVPIPLPPFFCYPHAIHCSLYLDEVNEENGLFCVLPGSHRRPDLVLGADDTQDLPGQVELPIAAGTCVLMHANLWHKTKASTANAGQRRLLLFSYCPSWMRSDQRGGVPPQRSFAGDRLKDAKDVEERELLGEFFWC